MSNQNESPKSTKTHACVVCNQVFSRADKLRRHITETHELKSVQEHSCSECDAVFKRKEHLNRHTQGVHFGKRIICALCDVGFVEFSRVVTHIRKVHKIPRCKICTRFILRDDGICPNANEQTICSSHKVKPLVMCGLCSKCFFQESELNTHTLIGCEGNAVSSEYTKASTTYINNSTCISECEIQGRKDSLESFSVDSFGIGDHQFLKKRQLPDCSDIFDEMKNHDVKLASFQGNTLELGAVYGSSGLFDCKNEAIFQERRQSCTPVFDLAEFILTKEDYESASVSKDLPEFDF